MTRRVFARSFIAAALAIAATWSARADSTINDWQSAVAAVDAASAAGPNPSAQSRVKLLEAAQVFAGHASSPTISPIGRAAAYSNVGSARLLAGDLPGAMLALKRAELYDPALPQLRQLLQKARSTLAPSAAAPAAQPAPASSQSQSPSPAPPPSDASPSALDISRSALNHIPPALLLILAAVTGVIASLSIAARAVLPHTPRALPGLARLAIVLACVFASALVFARWPVLTNRDAVLLASGVAARTAPGLTSPALAGLDLRPGLELQVLDTSTAPDGLWIRCAAPTLPLTTPFWINADAVEMVIAGHQPGHS